MNISPGWEGALRTLGIIILMGVLSWAATGTNLTPLMGAGAAAIITTLAGALENYMKQKGLGAMFGSVNRAGTYSK